MLVALAVPRAALAHARLVASDPPDLCAGVPAPSADFRCVAGVVVAAPPLVIRLTFNEPVQPVGRGIRVVAPSGRRAERGPARASGRSVSVDVDAAEQGTYVVNWRVVSGDAQPERGRFTFTVGRPTAPGTALLDDRRTVSRSGFVLAVVGRALHFLGYALGFGSLAFRWLVLRPLAVPRVDTFDRALWRLTRFVVMALVFAEPLVVLGHALRLGISGDADVLADVLESRVGLVTGQRLGIALMLWAVLAALETGSSTSLKLGLGLGIALAVIDGQAVHAVSVHPLAAGLVTNALHVAAMGTWVGTVIALLVAWQSAGVIQLRAAIARRAGRVASIALLVGTGSGALLTFQHLTGPGDLTDTSYGRLIVAKLATLILVLTLALAARWKGIGASERWWQRELAALETRSSISLKLGLALGIALAVIDGQAVHAVSVRPLAAGFVTNALHEAAMGTWVGTVVALLVVWRDVGVTPLRAAIARQAGRVAATALLVAMGSGTVLSFQHLTGTGDLASTFYGHVIVAKVAALIVILAFALAGRRKGVGMPERWWQAELAAFVAVLLLAAVLVSLPPPLRGASPS